MRNIIAENQNTTLYALSVFYRRYAHDDDDDTEKNRFGPNIVIIIVTRILRGARPAVEVGT